MKRIFTLITVLTLLGTLSANGVAPVDTSETVTPQKEISRSPDASFGLAPPDKSSPAELALVSKRITGGIPLLLHPGMDLTVDGSRLRIQEMTNAWTGVGTLYFPALDEHLAVEFNQLEVNAFGDLLNGTIQARTQVQGEGLGAMPTAGTTLPLNITSHLRSRPNFVLPDGAMMALTDVRVTDQGTFVSLDFDTPTLVEDDMLSFTGQRLKVDARTFCLEDTALDIVSGGGFIDDFEFPMRILAGDPNDEDAGSYVTFDCDGFKAFSLSAQYPFPRAQVVPAANNQDTVFATFRIKATGLGDFIAFATVTPFEIVGVEDMVYTIDSAYVDYSDADNPVGFDLDPVTNAAPETGWKGLFLRRLQVTLPETVGAFNGGEEILIGGQNIIYSRGKGMSGELYAYNLLDLSKGGLDGWGFSIDTVETVILQNSLDDFSFNGNVFIPVFGEGDKIAYNAFLGDESLTLELEVAGTYTVPFLGDVRMTLTEDSQAGVRFGSDGPEPYLSASGQIDISLGGEIAGITVPDVDLPGIRFQDFKLNDIKMAATQAADVATAGMDRMSFGTFDWSGINLGAAMDAVGGAIDAAQTVQDATNNPAEELTGEPQEKKVNGKPVSIEDIEFETVTIDGQELKRLKVHMLLNLTKGSGGISGDLKLGVRGQVDYAQLISLTPWEALSFHSLEVGDIAIEARFGNVEFNGSLSIYDQNEIYGKGFKGGLAVAIDLGATRREFIAMGQFGTAPADYDYFFVDFRTKFTPGITMGALELTGLGGGLYYNMTKQVSTQAPAFGEPNPPTNNTPGQSFSGSTYTPRDGSIGLAAACTVGLAANPTVFTSDSELTIEFGEDSGVRKILFDMDGYFFLSDPEEKNEASLKASIAMELNFERGFLSADFAYELRAPYENPLLTGGDLQGPPQGALMIDIAPEDDNYYSNYFYFGKPRRPADVAMKIGVLRLGVDAYVMIGSNLPDPVPLREIHPALADFPDVSRSQGNSIGFAFGVQLATKGDVTVGPLSVKWDVVAGVDASIRKYTGVSCANTGNEIGFNGWYIKGRAYAYISAGVKLRVKLNLGIKTIDQTVNLMDLSVAASLVAELPNPSYIGGKVQVEGSVLGFSVNKSVSIELGEKCEQRGADESLAAVSNVKVITGFYPEKDSDEASAFPIFDNPSAAFAYPIDYDGSRPYSADAILEVEDDEGKKTRFFPYLKEVNLRGGAANKSIYLESKWDNDHRMLTLSTEEVLEANSEYTFEVKVRWSIQEESGPWHDLTNDEGEYAEEIQEARIQTGPFPTTIALQMLDPERHFPGNGQRNWHRNFGPGEIYFSKPGMDEIFNTRVTKAVEGYGEREIDVRYAVRITNLETDESQEIPITERPGNFQLEELRTRSYSYEVPINTQGDLRTISYNKTELTSYSSRGIKYNGINAEGILEKNKIYRLEIMRIPIPDENAQNVIANRQEVVQSAGAEGVVVRSTTASIQSNADPFSIPDVVYSFAFRVSKYDNLQQKVELMSVAEAGAKGSPQRGIDHPLVETVSSSDIAGYPLKRDMAAVEDTYHAFRIDEGFDWWERQRLTKNLVFDAGSWAASYYQTPEGAKLKRGIDAGRNLDRMPGVWRVAFDSQGEEDGTRIWSGVTFPRPPSGEMEPKLTRSEIEAGTANEVVVSSTSAENNQFVGSDNWDLAVINKANRALTFQAAAMTMMARTFHANAPYYQSGYATGQSNSSSSGLFGISMFGSTSTTYSYTPNDVHNLNRMGEAHTYHEMVDRADDGRGVSLPKGLVIGGIGKEIKTVTISMPWPWDDEVNTYRTDFGYSRFQYTWRIRNNYSLPSDNDVNLLKEGMWGHGTVLVQDASEYRPPLKFFFADQYQSLTEQVRGGDVVTKSF